MKRHYDIVILGSGIAGSITALVLQQAGLETLVVERKTHPRFAIGESTLPTTTLLLQQFARRYGIPELAEITSYPGLRKLDCAAWPKQVFWFGVHRDHAPLAPRHESINEALLAPLGPDVHMLRADVDAFLVSLFAKYGVDYVENTELLDFTVDADGANVRLHHAQGEQEVRARYVVDATGHASHLAQKFGLRDETARLTTDTRSIFGHFRNVADIDDALGGPNPVFRFRRDAGTMHHCFPGGWFWVIPFDNGTTSVGLELDRQTYPSDDSLSAEDELKQFIARYPSIHAHLGAMEPIRPLTRAERIQFTSKTILGDRFILTPHAAGFIEPLFSTGIVLTLSFIDRFAPAAIAAHADNDWQAERFRFIERLFFAEIRQIDLLVSGTIRAFRDYDLFKQYWRNWVFGTLVQYGCCVLTKGATTACPMLYGAGMPEFVADLEAMHELTGRTDLDDRELARRIKALADPWWERVLSSVTRTRGDFSIGSESAVNVITESPSLADALEFFRQLQLAHRFSDSAMQFAHVDEWAKHAGAEYARQIKMFGESGQDGTEFRHAYERIIGNANAEVFDYRKHLMLKLCLSPSFGIRGE
jgi:FADH2 O2-dependent halogenase